jgi:hypothetical protein
LLIPLRKQDLPEGSEPPLNNESVLDSLEHWYEDNQTDSNFRQKSLEGWKFDLSGMTKYVEEYYEAFKNPTVPSKKKIEPVAEPTSDYWKTRQEVTPLANQDSGTSSSSDSLTDVEEESSSWMTYILYFVVAAVIGVIILVLLGVSLPEGGGGTAIMRFLVIPPIVWGLVWLVGKFKS